ncbi:ankyrin repeat and SOCS box protein 2-like [Engraulis encrasicolus]|uniref:ankyrin repeat and SOCS box protein 2-like n=1 Tax=Engraulis encrasicolus TaxID=184585 RepID=UPI002FD0947C
MSAAVNAPMAVSTTRANLDYEDYSIYGNLSEDELIQMVIERSLSETCSRQPHLSEDICDTSQTPPNTPAAAASQPAAPPLQGQDSHGAQRPATVPKCHAPHTTSSPSESQNETENSDGGRMKVLSWTRRNGMVQVSLNEVNMTAETSAIWINDVRKLRKILEEVPLETLSQPNQAGWTYLHEAAHAGKRECLNLLVETLPKLLNKRTKIGETPLHLAVARSHVPCVRCLLLAEADPNIKNNLGETPLFNACEKNNVEMVELLLQFGAKVSMATFEGMTPLHEAVTHSNLTMCELLVDAGANVKTKNVYGIDPLFVAAQAGHKETVDLLIACGANVNCQAKDGATPLYEAAKNGHEDVIDLLLSHKANLNLTNKDGLTPLHIAAKEGHSGIVSLLIPRTYRMIERKTGISPLHLAAEHNRDDVLEVLIEAGFKINTMLKHRDGSQANDDRCCTALHFAVRNGNVDAAHMLLEAGADPNVDTFNPLLVAVRHANIPMLTMLLKYGANVNACVPTFPTAFPGAILFCIRQTSILKLLLDYGCDANACFNCMYGSYAHPPMTSRRAIRCDLDLDVPEDLHGRATQFCDFIADPYYSPWAGPIIDCLLDYTGPVNLCSRITEVLESNKNWEYIKDKAMPSIRLTHLCRLKIRQLVGNSMLRQMTSLPLPGRLINFLFYDNEAQYDADSDDSCDFV